VINPYDEIEGVDELPAPPRRDITPADLELLSLAARALGARFEEVDGEGYGNLHFEDGTIVYAWNSLEHSDDAFNMAVELELEVHFHRAGAVVNPESAEEVDNWGSPGAASARRAITRAAAEIGKEEIK
jgi:hypothetical protein